MRLAFIGMSGAGKSHWTSSIAIHLHATLISSDKFIRKKLGEEIGSNSYSDTLALSAWLGLPNSPDYPERANKYLCWEQESIKYGLSVAQESDSIVMDTSGSVVHLEQSLLLQLKEKFKVIYLSFEEKQIDQVIDTYFSDPKPIIWGDSFTVDNSQSIHDQIVEAFPRLIAARRNAYQQLAHVTVPFEIHRGCRTPQELLSRIGL